MKRLIKIHYYEGPCNAIQRWIAPREVDDAFSIVEDRNDAGWFYSIVHNETGEIVFSYLYTNVNKSAFFDTDRLSRTFKPFRQGILDGYFERIVLT